MTDPAAIHNTFVLERRYPAPPEQVFSAFSDAASKRRWFAEGDTHTVEKFAMDFRIGGTELAVYRMKPGTPIAGAVLTSEGYYLEIVPDRRIVTASTMRFGEKRFSAALVTIELLAKGAGTDLVCTHQGAFFEGADGPKMREAGWKSLFERLAAELAR